MTPKNDGAVAYFSDHTYSTAPEAKTKLAIDLKFIHNDFIRSSDISITNEAYLKFLIETASNGKVKVRASTKLQFYIIRGGGEGFLPPSFRGVDASSFTFSSTSTTGVTTRDSEMDYNDLMVVFDKTTRLLSAARLERPLMIKGRWSKNTANRVYDSWNSREVFIYKNENFNVKFLGLGVRDPYRGKGATVDMHKQENTNGCIFIVDRATPDLGDDAALGEFEPQLIKDVLKQAGVDITKVGHKSISLGKMHLVTIK